MEGPPPQEQGFPAPWREHGLTPAAPRAYEGGMKLLLPALVLAAAGGAGWLFLTRSGPTYVPPQEGTSVSPFYPVLVPLLILAVPLFDAFVVVAIRFHIGQPVFKADKRHLSHRLVALGMTHREAVLSIYVITLCVALSAILLYYVQAVSGLGVLIILGQALGFLCLIVFMEQAGRRSAESPPDSPGGR